MRGENRYRFVYLKGRFSAIPDLHTYTLNIPRHPHCVAGVVQGGSVSSICTQIMTIVEQEQNKVLWIPDGAP